MSKHTHSPTPWRYEDGSIKGKNDEYVCDLYMTDNFQFSGQDNAAFIVKAVNNFDEMVVALKKAREDINWMLNNKLFLNPESFNYIDQALKNATEVE